jgi:hypothetical protein
MQSLIRMIRAQNGSKREEYSLSCTNEPENDGKIPRASGKKHGHEQKRYICKKY